MNRAVVAAAALMTFLPGAWVQAGDVRPADRASELSEALSAMTALIDAVTRADAGQDLADAPARLREMLRTGRAGESDVALITRWIFHEKEEAVARGFIDALRSSDLAVAGGHGERWSPAAAAMTALFESALRDAAARRRRDTKDWPELKALVTAAAPAIAASLSEADPATRAELQRMLAVAAEALRAAEPQRRPAEPGSPIRK